MRLWSFHPHYLDSKGLVAAWREALLARAVLGGKTKGYRNHPQLERFESAVSPDDAIREFLRELYKESVARGYSFDESLIGEGKNPARAAYERGSATARTSQERETIPGIPLSYGQLDYEWALFRAKLAARDKTALARVESVAMPEPHPLFYLKEGGIASWERVKKINA